jgi:hypothetical protein
MRTYFPDYELVVILAAQRGQVLFVGGEGEVLDEHLVQLQAVHHLQRVEVPNDDVGLQHAGKPLFEFEPRNRY